MVFKFLGRSITSEDGNVFFAIFGAVAMVGILGAAVMTFMKGPLSTSVKLTKMNTAENQMAIGAQIAVMATANQANNGDCETPIDNYVEPLEWRTPTTEPVPTGGGLVPLSLGISKKDPWGTEYGYCVWNHGAVTSGSGCGANMLAGTNSRIYPVVALVSAGPDKTFTTTCRSFATADGNSDGDLLDAGDSQLISKAADTDDDIHTVFTYDEATGASGGLWSIKTGDPATAVIDKKIEASGVASLQGGMLLADKALVDCNDIINSGVMAKNGTAIEICDGAGTWTPIAGGGGGAADGFVDDAAAVCDGTTAGSVRYNSTTTQPEFCNGTSWVPFALSSPTGSLVVLPASNYAMNITGPCSGGDCPYAYTAWTTFTASNMGLTATPVLSVPTITGANASNFSIDTGASTCDNGLSLAPTGSAGNSCTIVVRARANGNTSYSAQINLAAGALTATVPLYGVSTGFTCGSGTYGWGGIVVGACTGAGGTVPGTNQYILQEPGCGTSTFEPTCTGNAAQDAQLSLASQAFDPDTVSTANGLQNTAQMLSYYGTYPAFEYCNNLVKGGYSDWFLFTGSEQITFASIPVIQATFASQTYGTSTLGFSSGPLQNTFYIRNPITGSNTGTHLGTNNAYIRCARQHDSTAPSIIPDTNPSYVSGTTESDTVAFKTIYTPNLSASVTSAPITIVSHNTSINISVSGTGTPQYRINGGAWQTSGTLTPGNNAIEITATSPTTYGAERSITVNIGDDSGSWSIRTYDPAVTKNIFVTSTTYNGNLGGLTGANNICRTRAQFAGLSNHGTYQALLPSTSSSALDNIGWNWGTLQAVGGGTVAANPGALVDFSLSSAPNRTEFGTVTSSSYVWTGSANPQSVINAAPVGYTCTAWSLTSGTGIYGLPGSTGSNFFGAGAALNCTTLNPIYCVGPNLDLPNITCPGTVDATASKNTPGSYNVTVPGGCTVTFKLWGAGGGSGGYAGQGGGGGYAQFSETPSVDTTYYYTVGGGTTTLSGGSSAAGFGGGGACGNAVNTDGGGGASVLYRDSTIPANLLAVAGGGGGATPALYVTAKAGGEGGNVYSGVTTTGGTATCPGSNHGGGGGGGYDGSSGGGGLAVDTTASSLAGYGGQNWVASGAGITSSISAGSGPSPGNAGDSHRPAGAGCSNWSGCGWNSSAASFGAVVVIY